MDSFMFSSNSPRVLVRCAYLPALGIFPNVCELRYVKARFTGNAAADNGYNVDMAALCLRRHKKYDNPQSTLMNAAQLQTCGASPTAK